MIRHPNRRAALPCPPGFRLPGSSPEVDPDAHELAPELKARFAAQSPCQWCGFGVPQGSSECLFCAAERHGLRLHGRGDVALAAGLGPVRLGEGASVLPGHRGPLAGASR